MSANCPTSHVVAAGHWGNRPATLVPSSGFWRNEHAVTIQLYRAFFSTSGRGCLGSIFLVIFSNLSTMVPWLSKVR